MYSEKKIRKVESLAEKIGKLEVVQDYHNVENKFIIIAKTKMNRLKAQQNNRLIFKIMENKMHSKSEVKNSVSKR